MSVLPIQNEDHLLGNDHGVVQIDIHISPEILLDYVEILKKDKAPIIFV